MISFISEDPLPACKWAVSERTLKVSNCEMLENRISFFLRSHFHKSSYFNVFVLLIHLQIRQGKGGGTWRFEWPSMSHLLFRQSVSDSFRQFQTSGAILLQKRNNLIQSVTWRDVMLKLFHNGTETQLELVIFEKAIRPVYRRRDIRNISTSI